MTITNNNAPAVFTLNAPFADFGGVTLNNHALTVTWSTTGGVHYLSGYPGYAGNIGEVRSGSTIVTLYKEFLAFLPDGEHTLRASFFNFTLDGINPYAAHEMTFVLSRSGTTARSPKMGDDLGATLWYTLLFVSVLGISGVLIYNRPKNIKFYGNKRK